MNQSNINETSVTNPSKGQQVFTRNAAYDEYIDDLVELTTGLSPEDFDELYPELAR